MKASFVFSHKPINKALYMMMLTLLLAFVSAFAPYAAQAQRATATASAKIITQQFSTKEFRTNANYQETQETGNSGVYVQKNYQSEEKERPCDKYEGRAETTSESGISAKRPIEREEKKCSILMIELQ